jgi:hypothetical protein
MKNLVRALAARALGIEPVLLPRTGSLFEERIEASWEQTGLMEVIAEVTSPPRGRGVTSAESVIRDAQPVEPHRLPAGSDRASGRVSERAPQMPPDGGLQARRADGRRGDAGRDSTAAPTSQVPVIPESAGGRRSSESGGETRNRPRDVREHSAILANPAATNRSPATAISPEAVPSGRSSIPTAAAFSGEARSGGPRRGTDQPAPGAPASLDQHAPPSSSAAGRLGIPEQRLATRQPSAIAPTPDDSVVNVTIGRIEIRAIHAPAVKPTASKPSPFPSLEDYLQRTSESRAR